MNSNCIEISIMISGDYRRTTLTNTCFHCVIYYMVINWVKFSVKLLTSNVCILKVDFIGVLPTWISNCKNFLFGIVLFIIALLERADLQKVIRFNLLSIIQHQNSKFLLQRFVIKGLLRFFAFKLSLIAWRILLISW